MATYTDNYNLVKPTMAESADIRTINGNMDSVDNIMHATQVSLANAYDQNETYNTGDIVMYEFLMYECLDDNVTGTWDATKWQRTTAGEHGGGGGGSDVEITPTLQSGTKIADFEIDGVSGELYAPNGGGGGGGSDGVIEGLDYDRAEALTMPDYTGYTYTPTEDGVLMLKSYGSVGGVSAEATGYDTLMLSVLGDTWTCPWIPVNKGTEYTLKRMAQSSSFSSGSWFKFIPWKRGVFLAPMIYSTEEREVGVWVDDKPLYQKSYLLSTPIEITNNGASISSYIDNYQDIECFVRGQASYTENSYGKQGADIWVGYDSSTLKAYCSEGCVANVITLLYTKTADVAGSGSYGSLGVPMEHYDDTERVVGTYFGDTLYKRTIRQTNIDGSPSDRTLIETMSGVSEYVKSEAKFLNYSSNKTFSQYYISVSFNNSTKGLYYFIREMGSGVRGDLEVTVYYTKSTT